ncbi:MAG: hypothetical protein RMM58_03930 [Chloroflexota bacterium]|nr:hypothetical protein [Dehalococcoidia bacterium]MDW8253010.1 hypothetical protein [Chloroflexota bacterium]
MRDGIALGKRALPVIVLLPRGLLGLARDQAAFLGVPDFPLAGIERSLYGCSREEIVAAALALGPVIRRALNAEA